MFWGKSCICCRLVVHRHYYSHYSNSGRWLTTNNIIDLFARGNQELFHSAFIAWLLDEDGSHGLGPRFLREFISKLPANIADHLTGSLLVRTEYRRGNSRFDILLEPHPTSASFMGLVLENKIKSFGNAVQLRKYMDQGYDVVILAFLPETLDDAAKNSYTVMKYSDINSILQRLRLDPTDHYQFLVHDYRTFLAQTLSTYESIARYCNGSISLSDFRKELKTGSSSSVVRDNDVRTYSYYYYYLLADYIRQSEPDLVFGTCTYAEAERDDENTKWELEKNLQGPPYMEALIYWPCDTPPWKLHDKLALINTSAPVQIAPRIELRLDPCKIANSTAPDPEVGTLMLGTWSPELKDYLKNNEPYKSRLNKLNARRNFHCEHLALSNIQFGSIVNRIREVMKLIFNYAP